MMGWARKELGIELNPIRVVESALGKVGNIFEGAVGIITSGIKSIGKTVDNILKDPLPTIIQVVGAMNGIPPYVTSAAITAAKGGKLEDIAKSAAISYATSTFMQNTNIGQAIGQASKDIGSDFTVGLIEKYDLPMDTAVMVSRAATASLNSAFIGGVSAAISGQSISKGLTSGFTSGLLYSTTDSFFDALNKDPNWGFSPTALNLIKGAANTALSTIVSGKGDPAAAVGNYVAYATLKMGASSLYDSVVKAYEDFTGKTAAAEAAQDSYTTLKAQYDAEVARYNKNIADLKVNEETYKNVYNQQYVPIKQDLTYYEGMAKTYEGAFNDRKKFFEDVRYRYENWDEWAANNSSMVASGYTREGALAQAQALAEEANRFANSANEYATKHSELANSASTQAVIGSLRTAEANMNANVAALTSIQSNIETPANGNLAEQLKNAAEKYQKEYSNYASSKDAAERAAQNYNKIIAEVAARDATIDAVNSGAIDVVKDFGNGSYQLSNGLVMQDGKFFQDGLPAFTNAAGISQNSLEFADPKGNVVKYGVDTGRQLSSTDVKNIFARDYGITINDTDAKTFVGASYTNYDANKFKTFAFTKPLQEAAKEEGVTLTLAEIEAFVKNSTDITSAVQKVKEYADPRYMTVSEAQQALMDAGFSTEDAKVLAGQAAGSGVGNVEQVVTSNRPKLEEKAKQDLIKAGFSEETAELLAPKAAGPAANMAEVLNNREQLVPMVATPAEDVDGTKVGTLSAEGKEYADRLYDELKQMWPEAQDKQIKSVAEVASSDLYDWYHSMGRPVDVDDPSQFARGMAMGNGMLGITSNMVALQTSAVAIAQANENLSRYDQIDQGQQGDVLKQPGISDYTRFKLNQYITGDEETRSRLRNEEVGAIEQENKEVRSNMLRVFETYKELAKYRSGSEAEELNPYVPPSSVENFTDIETARQFGSWLAYNMGSGLVQFAPILAAGLTAGGAGVLALGATFGLQEAIGQRIQQLTKDTPNWSKLSEDAQADLIIKKMQESAGTNVLVGMGVGVLDTVLGPAAGAVKNSLFRAAAKDIVASGAVTALKGMPKEAAEEFVAGNLQQLAQIVGSRHLGEQTGDLFSVENLKAMFNAGMAETAGSIAGGGANVFVSGGLQQFGQASLDVAARKIDEQVKTQDLPQSELIRDPIVHVDTFGTRYLDTEDGLVIAEKPAGEIIVFDANNGEQVSLSEAEKQALIVKYVEPSKSISPIEAPRPPDQILSAIDSKRINEAEVRQMFADLGYRPTDIEIQQYASSKYDAKTAPSPDLVGKPVSQTDAQSAIAAYTDPKVVDAAEARAALEAAGFTNPTQGEIAQFVGVYPEAELASRTQAATQSLENQRLSGRIAELQKQIGMPSTIPTEQDVDKAMKLSVGIGGKGRNKGEPDWVEDYDLNGDGRLTAGDVLGLSKMSKGVELGYPLRDGVKWESPSGLYKRMQDVETAVKNIQAPKNLSEEDVRQIVFSALSSNPGLQEADVTRVVNDALSKLPAAPTKKDVTDAVNVGIGTRSVKDDPATPQNEAKDATGIYRDIEKLEYAIENIKFPPILSATEVRNIVNEAFTKNPGLSEKDVTRAISEALSKLPASPTKQDITDAVNTGIGARSIKDDPKTPQNEAKQATGIYREIEQIEAAISNIKFPPTLTEQQVKQIVATAFEENPGLTSKDVTNAIEAALDKVPASPTLDQINTAIGTQIGSRSVKDNPNTPQNESQEATGIYREIERLEGAIAGIKFPETLSDEQVREIVQGVFDKNPGLTGADVNSAIDAALSKLPAAPTLDEINRAITSQVGSPAIADDPKTAQNEAKDPTGIYREIKRIDDALANLEFPPTLSDEQVREIVRGVFKENPGLTNADVSRAIDAALAKLPTAPTLNEINQSISSQIGTRSVKDDPKTAQDESKAATGIYREIELIEQAISGIYIPPSLSEQQVRDIVGGVLEANPGLSTDDVKGVVNDALNALPAAPTIEEVAQQIDNIVGAPSAKDDPNTPANEARDATGVYRAIEATAAGLETKLGAAIEAAKAAGLKGDEALDAAIKAVAGQVGTSEQTLLAKIGKTADDLSKDFAAQLKTVTEQVTTVEEAIGKPETVDAQGRKIDATGLYAEIAKLEAAGMSREQATQKAIADLSTKLGASEAAIKAALTASETALGERITTVEQAIGAPESVDAQGNKIAATGLFAEIAKNEAAGMNREAATQKAIADLSVKLGASEAAIKKALTDTEASLGGRITTVEQAIGEPESVDANGNKVAATGLFAEIAKNEAAGMTREAATQKAIADLSKQLGASEAAIKNALAATESTLGGRITTVEQAIGAPASVDANGNPIAATGIFAEIAKNEAAGMSRDAATQKAISDLSRQLGASEAAIKTALAATESTLGGRITTVEQAVGAPESVDANGNKVAATGLFAEIAKNEAAGMSRDAATQKAIADLSADLGVAQNTILGEMSKAEARFGTALTGVQTALTNQITASQNQIMERMAVYEQAGIDRDTALNLAIQDVSAKLGGQMSNLQQLVGKPATVATQTDIDAINQMIAGTKPVNLSYDVTGDKLVDVRDLDALRDWMSGTMSITPIAGSPWAPTGLYEEFAKAAADRERIATEQSRQAQETQRRGNVMQMLNMIGQDPTAGGQQVTVKAADPAKIGYIYDWSSIFANPQQQQMFASPFAEGGEVADTDELIAILRGSHG